MSLLKDKLDKKEYALQVSELKVMHYEKYLQKKAMQDAEARTLFFRFHEDDIFSREFDYD